MRMTSSRISDIQQIPFKAGSEDNKPSSKVAEGSEPSVVRPGVSGMRHTTVLPTWDSEVGGVWISKCLYVSEGNC